jgi:hypothetical protein
MGRVGAEHVGLDGVSFDLPEGWRALEPAGDGPLPFGISALERRERTAGAWARSSDSGMEASLTVEVHPQATAIRRDLIPTEKETIERVLRAAPEISGFRLLDHGVIEIDGVPTYRIRGQVEVGGYAVEQLQFVLSGSETILLTFSWESGRGSQGECETIARSVRVDRQSGFLARGGPGRLGLVLGILAGLALASRRLAARRRRGCAGSHAERKPDEARLLS